MKSLVKSVNKILGQVLVVLMSGSWILLNHPDVRADDDIFKAPSAALSQTKYAADCGGFHQDIAPDMPPVDDQGNAPWCVVFADKAILEYYLHVSNPQDHYQNRLSVIDIDSWDPMNAPTDRGVRPRFASASSGFTVLEGVQASGQIFLDRDLPLDQALFDPKGTLEKLSYFYGNEKAVVDALPKNSCGDLDASSLGMDAKELVLLKDLVNATNESAFLSAVDQRAPFLPKPKAGAKRMPIAPPYDIRMMSTSTGDEYFEEIQKNLAEKRPMQTNICAIQLKQLPGLAGDDPVPSAMKNQCGPHGVDVVGVEAQNGKCMVHVRNSWGPHWPEPHGDGNVWIPFKSLLSVLSSYSGDASDSNGMLTSIQPRPAGKTVANQLISDGLVTTGTTVRGELQGQGTVIEQSDSLTIKYDGIFKDSDIQQGTMETWNASNSLLSTFKGQLKEFGPSKGHMTKADGTVADGSFSDHDNLTDGTERTPTDTSGAIFYSGPIVKGAPTGDGKYTDKDGHPVAAPANQWWLN